MIGSPSAHFGERDIGPQYNSHSLLVQFSRDIISDGWEGEGRRHGESERYPEYVGHQSHQLCCVTQSRSQLFLFRFIWKIVP